MGAIKNKIPSLHPQLRDMYKMNEIFAIIDREAVAAGVSFERILTDTEIKSLNSAAITLLAAPDAGTVNILESVIFSLSAGTAYVGANNIEINLGATNILAAIPGNTGINGVVANVFSANINDHIVTNDAVIITNATGDYTGGDAARVLKVVLRYKNIIV